MIRLAIIVLFVSLFASSVLAGTWRDDFEKGFVGWEGLDDCWKVENGECSGEYFNAPSGMMSVIWIGNVEWKDYTVKCKMKFITIGDFAGISFRDKTWGEQRYGFVINTQANTAWAWKVFQGAITFPSEIPLPSAPSKDTWYELKVIAKIDHFEFYIDGKPSGNFDDNSISSGKIGFTFRNAHVHFDDLIISGDDVEDGGSWDPAKHPGEKAVEPKSKLATMWGKIKSK